MNIFGFEIKRKEKELPSFAPKQEDDGAVVVEGAGVFGTYLDVEGTIKTEAELVAKYREISQNLELDEAIQDIVYEAIVQDSEQKVIEIILDDLKQSDSIKNSITEEFKNVLNLFEFNQHSHELFKRWYVDGRLYYHVIIDEAAQKEGIKELRYIDPRKIRKVRELKRKRSANVVPVSETQEEYFMFAEKGFTKTTSSITAQNTMNGIKISKDSIIHCTSGLTSPNGDLVQSYLHKAMRPFNQLRLMEDSLIIYRISRAPERRVFYVDVGDLPKTKAEQYLRDIMNRFKNKVVYDSGTGEIRNSPKYMTMLEDFWLPRRCLSLDTKIKLLDGRDVELQELITEYKSGKKNWVYSVSPEGKIVPGQITWAGVTRKNTEVVDVYLDNGEIITTTPDHKFILRNGEKVKAEDLSCGTSLMPLYSRKEPLVRLKKANNLSTYEQIQHNDSNEWEYSHRLVSNYIQGRPKSTEVIHHIDFNRYNNNPENLQVVDKQEHINIHSTAGWNSWKCGDIEQHKKNLSISGKKFFETEAGQSRKQEYNDKWNRGFIEAASLRNKKAKEKTLSHDFNEIKTLIDSIFHRTIKISDILISCQENISYDIKGKTLSKIFKHNGYNSINQYLCLIYGERYKWKNQYRPSEQMKNHKVIKVVLRDDLIDTGTITVDGNEVYHDYHNFALSSGVFVMNSGGRATEITTLPGGCLAMDTKVSLLDGRELSISDIETEMKLGKTLWTYSCDPISGEVVPGIISWAGVTQESAQVMKITLDNGESIICTPDHKFPVWDKGFVEARDLDINESMIALYRNKEYIASNKKLDYEQYFDNKNKKWQFTHRTVANYLKDNGVKYHIHNEEYSNGLYEVRHHIDFNRHNNSPENLVWMSWLDHSKLHTDYSFPPMLGTIAASEKMVWLKTNDLVEYQRRCDTSSKNTKEFWANLTDEEYKSLIKKQSDAAIKYIASLSPEEKAIRDESGRAGLINANKIFISKLQNPEYNVKFRKRVKDGWTYELRANRSKQTIELNNKIWNDPILGSVRREKHKEKQKIDFDHDMLLYCIDLIKNKTTHQFTKANVTTEFNNNQSMIEKLIKLNSDKNVPNWSVDDGYSTTIIDKLVRSFGYSSWSDFRKKESCHNHRIVSIEYLEDKIQVGTLTIDSDEKYHGHHTFALSCGIFTKNSNLGSLEDITYFQNKLYKSLNVPITRLNPEVSFNLGRSTEITRDEIKFSKFISGLRNKFSTLFLKTLEKQLILKGICTPEDWDEFESQIKFKFAQDNYYEELKETEVLRERISMLRDIDDYAGKYYSHNQIRKKVLRQTDDDIKENDKEIQEELNNPQYNPPEPEMPEPEPEPAPQPTQAPVTKVIIGNEVAKTLKPKNNK